MGAVSILLVIVNFLLFAATVGLLIATAVYASAARRMNKIANRQAALFALESYTSLTKASIGELVVPIPPDVSKFYNRCKEYLDELLGIAFDFDNDGS